MISKSLMTSDRPDWNTPEVVLERVRRLGPIYLDPCGNGTSIVYAENTYRLDWGGDGLRHPWRLPDRPKRGLVYVNPPYGREIGPWIERINEQAEAYSCAPDLEIVALVPARTDAKWFQGMWKADALAFWRGRLKFLGAPSSAPFPSVLGYWGDRPEAFRKAFEDKCHCV